MAGYRSRVLRKRTAPKPPQVKWWARPRNWVIAAAGTAATAVITQALTAGGKTIINVTGLTGGGRPPISWTVTLADSALNQCHRWTFAKPISSVPFFDLSSTDYSRDGSWAQSQGGVDLGGGTYTVTVQGNTDTDVIIRDVRIKVLSRESAVSGVTIASPGQCGGAVSLRRYSANLDDADPHLVLDSAYGLAGPADQEYTVSASNPEVFLFEADLVRSRVYCTYVYEIDWSQGPNMGTIEIMAPDGKPFGANNPTSSGPEYLGRNGQWITQ